MHGRENKRNMLKSVFITIGVAFLLTCAIEFTQYYFHIGNAELSDIIMNTVGATIGTLSFIMYWKIDKNE